MEKLKMWLFEGVILKKVAGKFAKHAAGAIVGLLFGSKLAPFFAPILQAMNLTSEQVQAGVIVAVTAFFGAAWNYIEHRFVKKKEVAPPQA